MRKFCFAFRCHIRARQEVSRPQAADFSSLSSQPVARGRRLLLHDNMSAVVSAKLETLHWRKFVDVLLYSPLSKRSSGRKHFIYQGCDRLNRVWLFWNGGLNILFYYFPWQKITQCWKVMETYFFKIWKPIPESSMRSHSYFCIGLFSWLVVDGFTYSPTFILNQSHPFLEPSPNQDF